MHLQKCGSWSGGRITYRDGISKTGSNRGALWRVSIIARERSRAISYGERCLIPLSIYPIDGTCKGVGGKQRDRDTVDETGRLRDYR